MLFFGIIGYHNISYVGNVHMHRIPASDPIFIFLIVLMEPNHFYIASNMKTYKEHFF
jgi:hypothetical protein